MLRALYIEKIKKGALCTQSTILDPLTHSSIIETVTNDAELSRLNSAILNNCREIGGNCKVLGPRVMDDLSTKGAAHKQNSGQAPSRVHTSRVDRS